MVLIKRCLFDYGGEVGISCNEHVAHEQDTAEAAKRFQAVHLVKQRKAAFKTCDGSPRKSL